MDIPIEDLEFDRIYPPNVRKLTFAHWSPVEVSRLAADYLVTLAETRVLDIGSGAGKFCIIGALTGDGHFIGVEQRQTLVKLSKSICKRFEILNTEFFHANIVHIDFLEYDAFYIYNPFQENLYPARKMDGKITCSKEHYLKYTKYVKGELAKTPVGTRLVTYWYAQDEIPKSFEIENSHFGGKLLFWQKIN